MRIESYFIPLITGLVKLLQTLLIKENDHLFKRNVLSVFVKWHSALVIRKAKTVKQLCAAQIQNVAT